MNPELEDYIRKNIPVVKATYGYADEGGINAVYEAIPSTDHGRLRLYEKRIWALRSDFILATGIKNAYKEEHGYNGLAESLDKLVHKHVDWKNRYGHPSLTLPEGKYDGSAYYAGYLCQHSDYLQVYLCSGRFDRTDLNEEATAKLETYIAEIFWAQYGEQDIQFDQGDSNNPAYHALFFKNAPLPQDIAKRRYSPPKPSCVVSPEKEMSL